MDRLITKRQRQILRRYADGHPPTFQELCHELGLRSTATVREHLEALERKGLLTRVEIGVSRNWRITDKAQRYLARLDAAVERYNKKGKED